MPIEEWKIRSLPEALYFIIANRSTSFESDFCLVVGFVCLFGFLFVCLFIFKGATTS